MDLRMDAVRSRILQFDREVLSTIRSQFPFFTDWTLFDLGLCNFDHEVLPNIKNQIKLFGDWTLLDLDRWIREWTLFDLALIMQFDHEMMSQIRCQIHVFEIRRCLTSSGGI